MNARDALEYLDERLIEHYATPFDGIRDALATLRACVEACEAVKESLSPYRGPYCGPDKAYTVSRPAIQQLRNALEGGKK